MKKIAFIISLIILVWGCQKSTDKKEELARLMKEHDKISEQISKLQQEIAATDTTLGSKMKVRDVAITAVVLQPFNHYIEIQGKVDGEENVVVNPRGQGVVISIKVVEGQSVKKGQVLAELDTEVQKKALVQLQDQLAFATNIYNKQKNLWDQKIGSEIQYLTAKNNKESLENQIKTTQEQLDMNRIVSPISGSVEEIPIKVGQMISPALVAFRVINFSKTKIVADLAEAYAPKVNSGDKVQIYFPDYQKEVGASLNFASRFINPINRTFQVEAKFDPGQLQMKANMIAVVKINDYHVAETVVVPVNALQKDVNGKYVFVALEQNGHKIAHKVPVTESVSYSGMIEIPSGLKVGDKVITLGYQDLNEGQILNY
ncbi:MAG: efflux RND transporter periplasmic adaptor subunit [Bacteroidetes bacterium]|nr:efflux RND transporter periplasmic adaptor subunit [Bacteroidota bacterium]